MSPATYASVDRIHRQELVAAAAHTRALSEARQAIAAPTHPRRAARAGSLLRRAAATIAALSLVLTPRERARRAQGTGGQV